MEGTWVAEVDRQYAFVLGQLRLHPGLELSEDEASYWLRGTPSIEEARKLLQAIPYVKLYHRESSGLRLWGHLLVSRPLPVLSFKPLQAAIRPRLPMAKFTSAHVLPTPLSLVRSDSCQPSEFLETTLEQWERYAIFAPKVRLDRWAFAVEESGRVLVHGRPLPDLAGRQYWESNGVVIPVGWVPSPRITGEALSRVLNRSEGEFLILSEQGTMESILKDNFVHTSRSAVRVTVRAVMHHEC